MSAKNPKAINFIEQEVNPLERILKWSMTYGLALTGLVILVVIGSSYYTYDLENKSQALKTQIENLANQIKNQAQFEQDFLLTQEKLMVYGETNNNEKMADLFPKLSTLIPEGVQVKDLTIEPDLVEIVGHVSDQVTLTRFVNNLALANNAVFENGQKLTVGNPDVREIAKSVEQRTEGYNFSLSFNYQIQ